MSPAALLRPEKVQPCQHDIDRVGLPLEPDPDVFAAISHPIGPWLMNPCDEPSGTFWNVLGILFCNYELEGFDPRTAEIPAIDGNHDTLSQVPFYYMTFVLEREAVVIELLDELKGPLSLRPVDDLRLHGFLPGLVRLCRTPLWKRAMSYYAKMRRFEFTTKKLSFLWSHAVLLVVGIWASSLRRSKA